MYAQVLRKWSLTKYLMYLWIPVIMLLVICCPSATSMHLSINTNINADITAAAYTTTIKTPVIPKSTKMVSAYITLADDTRNVDNFEYNDYNNNDHHIMMPIEVIRYGSNSKHIVSNNYLKQQPHQVIIKSSSNSIASNAVVNINNAAANVPNLNSQVINLNNNYNNDEYISLTNSANKKLLGNNRLVINSSDYNSNTSGINYNKNNDKSNNKFLKPIQSKLILPSSSVYYLRNQRTKIYDTKNTLIKNRKVYFETFSSLSPPLLPHGFGQNINLKLNEKNNKFIILMNSNRNQRPNQILLHKQENIPQSPIIENDSGATEKEIISLNENSQQRVKNARNDTNRQSLIRLKQLSTSLNYDDHNRDPLLNNKFTTITTTTTVTSHSAGVFMDNDLNKLMIGRNRRDSRSFQTTQQVTSLSSMDQRHFQHQQQQQQQQERKRLKRYCSARDPTQLAFEAPTVFEGKIKSMSYDRRANFSVTFEVKQVYKSQLDYKLPELLRLQFTYSNTSGECDIYREHLRPRGVVREELEQGRVYILFVKQITKGNFTILGQPVKRTRRAVNAVRLGVSEKYAQPASIKSLTANRTTNKITVRDGDTVRLLCKVTGQPTPKVTWFKDGKSISRNRIKSSSLLTNHQVQYQFIHLKKRSELIIRPFNSIYAGLYECRAKNKLHKKPAKETIRVEAFSRNSPPSDETSFGGECPGDMQSYCLNGATCRYFRDIHEKSCVCPEGYNGERCQEKTTTLNTSTYQKEHQQCESYKGGFYC